MSCWKRRWKKKQRTDDRVNEFLFAENNGRVNKFYMIFYT